MNFMKPHKVSTHSANSDNCNLHFSSLGCLIQLKFCEVSWNSFSNRCWKFQLSILKNKNDLFIKKYFFGPSQYQNKKALFTDSIFPKVLVYTFLRLNVFTMDCFCLWYFFSLMFYVDCIHHSKIIAKLLCKLLIKGVYDMLMAYKIFLLPGQSKMMHCK